MIGEHEPQLIGELEPANGALLLYSSVGASMAFRRLLLCSLGAFDEALSIGGDDDQICRPAHAQPTPIPLRHVPAAGVLDHFSPSGAFSSHRALVALVGVMPAAAYPPWILPAWPSRSLKLLT
jgi:hypothetical protein